MKNSPEPLQAIRGRMMQVESGTLDRESNVLPRTTFAARNFTVGSLIVRCWNAFPVNRTGAR
jgi:hypothetical protein